MLFTGEEGIGKKRFALEVARALNCRTPKDHEGCGVCSSCVRIAKLNYPQREDADEWTQIIWTDHPDVGLVVAPKRVLRVEQMRQIEKEANFRPFEGKARVFLIDEADKLNDASANALLKVLEEPPRTSHLILITARPAMLSADDSLALSDDPFLAADAGRNRKLTYQRTVLSTRRLRGCERVRRAAAWAERSPAIW